MSRVVFIHPDLGIGGAERAMVDAALALKSQGKECIFYTSHHDKNHCFTETKDGTFRVVVAGDRIPRSIFGYCHAFFAYLRMMYTTLTWLLMGDGADIVICDQISCCIPFLKWFATTKVLFYCHFPDKLLAQRGSLLRKCYRAPIDWLEEKTTGMADVILVNSKFTAKIFKQHFQSLSDVSPDVVYPVPDFSPFEKPAKPLPDDIPTDGTLLLSLNRYERKKNVGLAIEALDVVLSELEDTGMKEKVHLVIAGGYDDRVTENVDHYSELKDFSRRLGLQDNVTFLRSVTDDLKHSLLKNSDCLIYTPENEHFGIVPVEAMYCKCPVVAANSGGPLETVANGETGFLCQPSARSFADQLLKIIRDKELKAKLGESGHKRMIEHFSFDAYTEKLNGIIDELLTEP